MRGHTEEGLFFKLALVSDGEASTGDKMNAIWERICEEDFVFGWIYLSGELTGNIGTVSYKEKRSEYAGPWLGVR